MLLLACIVCSQCVNEHGININIKQIQIKKEQIKHTSYDNNNQNIIKEYLTTKTTKANIDKLSYKLYFVHQNYLPKSFAKTNNINKFSYLNNSDEFKIFNNFDKNALYFNLNFSENNNNFLNKTKRFFKLSFIKNNVSKKLFNIKLLEPKQSITIQKPKTKRLSIRELIKQAESKQNIPSGLLKAIGLVESRLQPYCINYNGRGYSFKTKSEAVKFINDLIRKGETNFSVGCFQHLLLQPWPSHQEKVFSCRF